jgi:hypothetical protein
MAWVWTYAYFLYETQTELYTSRRPICVWDGEITHLHEGDEDHEEAAGEQVARVAHAVGPVPGQHAAELPPPQAQGFDPLCQAVGGGGLEGGVLGAGAAVGGLLVPPEGTGEAGQRVAGGVAAQGGVRGPGRGGGGEGEDAW